MQQQAMNNKHVGAANEWLKEQQDQDGVNLCARVFRNAAGEEYLQVTSAYRWQFWLCEAGFAPIKSDDYFEDRRHRWVYQDAVDATPQEIVDCEANNRSVNVWMSESMSRAFVAIEFYELGHDEVLTYRKGFDNMPDAVMHAIEIANTPGRLE